MIPSELMAAVCGDRSDDLPRLVVADWLDDRGECERAEFIRVQCEIAKWNARPMPKDCAMTADKFSQLLFREALLLENHRYGWIDGLLGPGWKTCGLSGALVNFTKGVARTQPFHCIFQRGFIGEVICQWVDWSYHSAAILAAAPVGLVRLTTELPVDMTRVAAVGADYIDYRLGRFAKSGTWRVTIPRDYSSAPSVDLGVFHYDRAVDELLKNHWPGVRFELPRSSNFVGVQSQRGPIEFAPLVPEGSGSGTRGG